MINEKKELIAGRRRLEAFILIGRKKIPVTVVSVDDVRKAEIAENRERKDFTVEEMYEVYRYLKPQLEIGQGTRTDLNSSNLDEVTPHRTEEKIARYLGVGKDTLRKIVTIIEEGIPEEVDEANSRNRMISKVYNKIKKRKNLEHAHSVGKPNLPEGKYDILYADPPWLYDSERSQRGKAEHHYATMPTEDIMNLEVPSADNALLFLWVTNAHLEDGLQVGKKWGFEYLTNFVWVKDKIGLGYYMRGQHELILIGRKGSIPPPEDHNRFSSVINAVRVEHSAKPEVVYNMIETIYPNRKYLELFSRKNRKGWTSWGL